MLKVLGVLGVLWGVVAVAEANDDLPPHRAGPAQVELGDGLEIDLPAGMILFERTVAHAMMEADGENTEGVLGIVMRPDGDWSITLTMIDVGYVTDTDAGQLDGGELMGAMMRGNVMQNQVRRAKGVSELFLDGWSTVPSYDAGRRALRWGLKLHLDDGSPLLNEFTNVLGRRGYVGINLIASPDQIEAARIDSAGALEGVRFQTGHRYEDFDPKTDRHSGMSLRNLVVGTGIVAAGSKLGIFAAILVFLKKGFLLIAAGLAGVWKWITSRRKNADA